MRENAKAGSKLRILSLEEFDTLMDEASQLGRSFCRRCGYCLPCEDEIPIREIMASDAYIRNSPQSVFMYGGKEGLTRFQEAIERCTECGECVARCPYDLPIPDLMPQKVAFFAETWQTHFEN
jgi:predicted aldo/keto reductase-like oxidoreductase